jgi:DNA-3-methyladenine glycosylase
MKRAFFEASPERVAPRLLGKILVSRTEEREPIAGRIVEVEAYLGPHHKTADPAAHSHRGQTPRNAVLFGPAGHAYVYAIYGRYYCMNISCEREGHAGCVLLRALEPVAGLDLMAWNRGLLAGSKENESSDGSFPPISQKTRNGWGTDDRGDTAGTGWGDVRELTCGPSRLCQALGLTRAEHNGLDLLDGESPLQLWDDGFRVKQVLVTRRIGIRHAAELPLRFSVPGHNCVSGPRSLTGKCIFQREPAVNQANRIKSHQRATTP